MNTEAFITAYNESRNGADFFVRHALVRTFAFSNGVQECADAGCHWLIDIAATEIPAVMRKEGENLVTFAARVSDGEAGLTLLGSGDRRLRWTRHIDMTDMPEGEWNFLIADEGEGPTPFRMILVTEY